MPINFHPTVLVVPMTSSGTKTGARIPAAHALQSLDKRSATFQSPPRVHANTSSSSGSSWIKFKVLSLPPIDRFDSNPLYHEGLQTKHGQIYITKATDSGLKIYEYNIQTDEWREFYDFGYAVQCSQIGNAIDSINNQLYLVSNYANPLNTTLCGLNLDTKRFMFKKVKKKQIDRLNNSPHLLMSIPSSSTRPAPFNSELHLLYGSSMNHMRFDVNPCRGSLKYKEYDGVTAHAQARVCSAKSIYIPSVRQLFAFGGTPHSALHLTSNPICATSTAKNEIEIKPNATYETKAAVSNSIWHCDINGVVDNYRWRIYKQRLPQTSCDYAILNCFSFLVFLFYYDTDHSIWCLDLLTGALVKQNKVFPLNCFEEMRMISTTDNRAHFMLINKDYGWMRTRMYGLKRYINELTAETTWNEPKIWMDQDTLHPSKRCNFHISLDLLDVVPLTIRQRHRKIYRQLITWLISQHMDRNRVAMDLIHLIGHFTSRLYYR